MDTLVKRYENNGYISAVDIFDEDEALQHRRRLEAAEAQIGSLHYKTKAHTILTSPYEIATNQRVLDVVESLIGPNILLYNVTYIIKEPKSLSHVSWHQDLTYWGLSHDDQVSMWLALSPANEISGCMKMIAGSHKRGKIEHHVTEDETNVLLQGQTVKHVDTENSELCPLKPGQASFHHGWTLHASMANQSADRRIGLNIQFLATHVRQTKHNMDTAMLVRGVDNYHHFGQDVAAKSDLEPEALKKQKSLEALYRQTAGT